MTSTVSDVGQSLVLAQYETRLRRQKASPHTLKNWGIIAGRYDGWLRDRGVTAEDASMADVEDYFDSLPLADSSKGTHLRMIQAAYNYGAKAGRIKHNPALDVVLAKPRQKEPRIIPADELRKIRHGISLERDWLWFHVLAYTGMRRSEVAGMVWDDGREEGTVLKLEEQSIRVLGKSQKIRVVPIHPALGDVLLEARREPGQFVIPAQGGRGVSLDTIQRMSKRIHPVFTPHDFRRTVSTSMDVNGVNERVIDRIMGWGAATIFAKFYRSVADPELHRGILRLYANDPIR